MHLYFVRNAQLENEQNTKQIHSNGDQHNTGSNVRTSLHIAIDMFYTNTYRSVPVI